MAKKLGELLIEKGLISPEDLAKALKEQSRSGEFLGTTLVRMGAVKEPELLATLSEQFGLPLIHLREASIDPGVVRLVPAKFVSHYKVMPVKSEGKVLTVAIHDPLVRWPLDELALQLGFEVESVLASETEITEAIRRYYGVGAETVERILTQAPETAHAKAVERTENLDEKVDQASVVRLVNQILSQAIQEGASDIHIEPFRDEMFLRYRVDGRLYDTPAPPDLKYLYPPIVSRIKIIAGLDIIERRMPQDGRARVRVGENELDLRISVLPTLYGENIVIRILPTSAILNLDKLGLSPEPDLKTLEQLLGLSHGIIFVTGPTGSGKTTTLYACLNRLNVRDRSIVTIEDPVEYELRGITQIQVNPKINLTFAKALRNVLRHDPNIMMVGEVRDKETAEITVQAALTGHLVFSTLHTNDAAGGVTRLVNMEIDPYLVASAVEAFIAQRLIRLICRECREEVSLESAAKAGQMPAAQLQSVFKGKKLFQGKGCRACRQTGYRGRTAIYEILVLKPQLKEMIQFKAPIHEVKKRAIELGMRTLSDDGWVKVNQGLTTPEEVLRVTQIEET